MFIDIIFSSFYSTRDFLFCIWMFNALVFFLWSEAKSQDMMSYEFRHIYVAWKGYHGHTLPPVNTHRGPHLAEAGREVTGVPSYSHRDFTKVSLPRPWGGGGVGVREAKAGPAGSETDHRQGSAVPTLNSRGASWACVGETNKECQGQEVIQETGEGLGEKSQVQKVRPGASNTRPPSRAPFPGQPAASWPLLLSRLGFPGRGTPLLSRLMRR